MGPEKWMPEKWMMGASGLCGPWHLVAQAERSLEDDCTATAEGFIVLERPDPLVTVLLLLGVAAEGKGRLRRWTDARVQGLTRRCKGGQDRRASSRMEVPMYVCLCQGLKESDVQHAALAGNTTPDSLITALKLTDPKCCGRCAREIDRLLLTAAVPPRIDPAN